MHPQPRLDDAPVEAVLRGGPVPADVEPLASALGTLRDLPEQPVRPSAELATRMATGGFASAAAPRPNSRSAGRYAAHAGPRSVQHASGHAEPAGCPIDRRATEGTTGHGCRAHRPDQTGKPESIDPRNELSIQPRSTD